ncbi:hypothetical protein PIB30_034179 [Stylosanthes scabra]|uniref:Aminotransferase-like plant mobile domain-containing protein n=1 Tax=Stylosanthes scabra TaxID=79078 RepID=A0ABU6Z9M0_9FABA|nr:hypothetical protein [Stylosanthes scabra]
MILHDRIILYHEVIGSYQLAPVNNHWFRVDKPLVNAFLQRWRSEMHTFHMTFGECTVTLQDIAYQFGLLLMRFMELPYDTDEETVMISIYHDVIGDLVICWGSTIILAWLYKSLCRAASRKVVQQAGLLGLLQSWTFCRFSSLRLHGFDDIRWSLESSMFAQIKGDFVCSPHCRANLVFNFENNTKFASLIGKVPPF